jgi:FPC/CPF motif-containing protein YcgG
VSLNQQKHRENLEQLIDDYRRLARDSDELGCIRATLIVNYDSPAERPESYIGYNKDKTILWNLVNILEHLTNKK